MEHHGGPVELIMLEFPGNKFNGQVAPTFFEMVDRGLIRVIDLVVATKDSSGEIGILEIEELDEEVSEALTKLTGDESGLLSAEDLIELAAELPEDCTSVVILFENSWAAAFADAVQQSGGRVVLNERVPRAAIEEARRVIIEAANSI